MTMTSRLTSYVSEDMKDELFQFENRGREEEKEEEENTDNSDKWSDKEEENEAEERRGDEYYSEEESADDEFKSEVKVEVKLEAGSSSSDDEYDQNYIKKEDGVRTKSSAALSCPCPLCLKNFKNSGLVRMHLRRFHKLDAANCKMLIENMNFSDTNNVHHADGTSIKSEGGIHSQVPCGDCGQTFKNYMALNKHVDNYHKIGDYTCNRCEQKFQLKGKLKSHIFKEHSEHYKKVCHICAQTVQNLSGHIKNMHMPDEETVKIDLTCPHCQRVFKKKKYLKGHIYTAHSDPSRAMICPYCSKECRNKIYYNQHVRRVHGAEENVKREECPDCGKDFPNKDYLRGHINTVHVVDARTCEICGRFCKNQMTLNNHMKNTHRNLGDEVNVPCAECGKIFRDQKRLGIHVHLTHKIGDYPCKRCGERFELKYLLKNHVRNNHKTKKANEYV